MKPVRKSVSLLSTALEAKEALRDLLIEQPRQWLLGARERMRDLPKSNFDLGCSFAEEGKLFDAVFRFRVVKYLNSDYPQLHYNLGCCYYRMGKLAQASEELLAALRQSPGDADTAFMLMLVDPSAVPMASRPVRMPAAMVSGFFSSVAANYDRQEAANRYQAGKLLHDLLQPLVQNAAPRVVDFACGTGIVSRPWRAAAGSVIGVDCTVAMVEQAEKATHADKKLFDQVIVADVAQPLPLAAGETDVVLFINAAQFVGDLSGVMQNAANALASQGVFALTVEPHDTAMGFGLSTKTSSFGHSADYVKQAASAAGLAFLRETKIEPYPGMSVLALVFLKGTM